MPVRESEPAESEEEMEPEPELEPELEPTAVGDARAARRSTTAALIRAACNPSNAPSCYAATPTGFGLPSQSSFESKKPRI